MCHYINITWVQHVHDLTLSCPGAELLDLPELSLETVVHPGEDLVSEEERDQMVIRWSVCSTFLVSSTNQIRNYSERDFCQLDHIIIILYDVFVLL